MKRKIIKKVSLILVLLTLFNVITPNINRVYANEKKSTSILNKSGGVLLNAIKDLVVFLADSVLQIMQETMIAPEPILITTDTVERNKGNQCRRMDKNCFRCINCSFSDCSSCDYSNWNCRSWTTSGISWSCCCNWKIFNDYRRCGIDNNCYRSERSFGWTSTEGNLIYHI